MNAIPERSAGIIPYRLTRDGDVEYLVLHSALVRNPRAKWEFPKGTVEPGETTLQAALREFIEETGLRDFRVVDDFERTLSYTYVRRGRKIFKTVTYFGAEVLDDSTLVRSFEHIEDVFGYWYYWGNYRQIQRLLYHAKIRQVFVEADVFIRDRHPEIIARTPDSIPSPDTDVEGEAG